jgi:hypothetical protein
MATRPSTRALPNTLYSRAARAISRSLPATLAASLLCGSVAMAQTVDSRINAPPAALNNPERGALGQQFQMQESLAPTLPKPPAPPPTPGVLALDPRKSIFVTDVETVSKLTFFEVMDQLRRQSNDPTLTTLNLFRQWWDTAARAPGTFAGPHCEDAMNGFFFQCPRPEAQEAASDPFTNPNGPQGYSAIAYSNRLDLADPQNPGRGCGEQRVVFARNSGKTDALNRLLIIFEAMVPNPQPHRGLDGCLDIQKFWYGLSGNMTPTERGDRLRDFFLNGIPAQSIRPVVHIDSYTNIGGQIRTNQFLGQGGAAGFVWTLREFKIQNLQPGIRIIPVTVKTNPDVTLFSGSAPIDLQAEFVARLAKEISALRGGPSGSESSSATIGLSLSAPGDDKFNPFESNESQAQRGSVEAAFKADALLGTYLTAKLNELKPGTQLTPADVVRRIQTQTCAGCHEWSTNHPANQPLGAGATWPRKTMRFVHTNENEATETVNGVERFKISETLNAEGFIPTRCRLVASFLNVPHDQSCELKN